MQVCARMNAGAFFFDLAGHYVTLQTQALLKSHSEQLSQLVEF